jgi:hypothetical protein
LPFDIDPPNPFVSAENIPVSALSVGKSARIWFTFRSMVGRGAREQGRETCKKLIPIPANSRKALIVTK